MTDRSNILTVDQDLPPPVTARSPNTQNPSQATKQSIFQLSSHPIALFFFLAFRSAALTIYLLGLLFTSNFIFVFVIIVLLLAFDFWTVKNVSGRLLVGLRWWNETESNGESVWVFESADPQKRINPTDSRLFWIVLYIVPVIWLVFALVAMIKFEFIWLTLVVIALTLNMANVVAFTRCDRDTKQKWATGFAASVFSRSGGLTGKVFGGLAGRLFG
ncbi:Golgi apparatus membrane protein tvp23 [Neolecta irregularis DAH-3]|uniref:Golgi apparatus membrane protein TVP23 n=1 Tax=Neolecta irregularis (strain DAH-3) TaxID=1198029 RepID=A0A1U7LUX7_NEOID|nr:Golgi apparatus membrane protein tvp23 [Neolecta irregularis DAH-3]|eukprot:OLL26485.1 Golgi apparatus membrane protein tvp23 [Neolecta irregularis DAH-3]